MSGRDEGGAERRHIGPVVRKEITIDATPEEVWEAWAEPEGIARWFVDRAEGRMEAGATITWIFETFGYHLPIEVYEAERGRTLVFGGEPPGGRRPSRRSTSGRRGARRSCASPTPASTRRTRRESRASIPAGRWPSPP